MTFIAGSIVNKYTTRLTTNKSSNFVAGSIVSKYTGQTQLPTEPSGVSNYVKESLKQVGQTITHPFQTIKNVVKAGAKSIANTYTNFWNKGKEAFTGEDENFAKKTADVLKAAVATVGAIPVFSVVSSIFSMAQEVPVLRQAADAVGLVFNVAGKIGAFVPENFIKLLPISQEDKDILAPAFGEVGALAGQIYLGGRIMKKLHTTFFPEAILKAPKAIKFIEEIKIKYPEFSEKLSTIKFPEKLTVNSILKEASKVLKPEELKVIEPSVKILSKQIKTEFKNLKSDWFENKPLKGKVKSIFKKEEVAKMVEETKVETELAKQEAIKKNPELNKTTPTITPEAQIKPVETTLPEKGIITPETKIKAKTDPVKVTKDAETLKREFPDDPVFKGTTFEKVSAKFNELLQTDRAKTLEIALGKEPAPEGLPATAVAKLLGKDPNLTLEELSRLTDSPYVVSKAGQELSLSGITSERTPVEYLKEVKQAKETRVGEVRVKSRPKIKDEIKSEIDKATPDKKTLLTKIEDFIDKNICP